MIKGTCNLISRRGDVYIYEIVQRTRDANLKRVTKTFRVRRVL